MTNDWFRKETWSSTDQADFELHLKRSRGVYNKSQYLRIQAYHLQHASPPLYSESLELIERVLCEFRDDSQVAIALFQKAECLQALKGFPEAIPVYRQVIEFEKTRPQNQTRAWIDFPWQIVKEAKKDLYDEALTISSQKSDRLFLPIDLYRVNLTRAIIAHYKGHQEQAKICAKAAYQAVIAKTSGLSYHKHLGVVDSQEEWAERALKTILN